MTEEHEHAIFVCFNGYVHGQCPCRNVQKDYAFVVCDKEDEHSETPGPIPVTSGSPDMPNIQDDPILHACMFWQTEAADITNVVNALDTMRRMSHNGVAHRLYESHVATTGLAVMHAFLCSYFGIEGTDSKTMVEEMWEATGTYIESRQVGGD